ncbi:MAG: hypothetical protein RLZZ630_518 [Bacteroidota bacterium]
MPHVFSCCPDTLPVKPDTTGTPKDTLMVPDSLIMADDFKSKVTYQAEDSVLYDLDAGMVYLYGQAKMNYEDVRLEADYIHLNFNSKTLFSTGIPDSAGNISGRPVFHQGEDVFNAETIQYNFQSKRGKITGITTKEGDGFIHGQTVKKEADNTTFVQKGYYTTCDADTPHYCLKSGKIKVIPNNKVVTGPADLHIMNVPTPVAIPFGFFPNMKGRSSGIILPMYGESRQLGFFLRNGGYYLGVSDHFDLALTGDLYSRGSWRVNAFSNYSWRYRFSGNFSANYSYSRISREELPDYSLEKAFFIRWNHTQDAKARPGSTFTANVNAGSNSFYRFNLSNSNNFLTNTFTSSIAWSKSWTGSPFNLSVAATHSQNTQTQDISLSIPSATFNMARQTPFKRRAQVGAVRWYEKIGVGYTTSFLNTITTKDSLLFQEGSLQQFRYGMQHSIPINTNFTIAKYLTVTPGFSYNERWYMRTIDKSWDPEAEQVVVDTVDGFRSARDFSFSTSMNTRIYGLVQFRKGRLAAIRHVMTPSISFTWRPDFSSDFFGYYKEVQVDTTERMQMYSIFEGGVFGGPGFGKASILNFSLDNNFEMKLRKKTDSVDVEKKVKILESLALNTNYNLAADSLNWAPISITARATIVEKVSLNMFATLDPYALGDNGLRINRSEWEENGRLARLTNGNASVNFAIVKKSNKEQKKAEATELEKQVMSRVDEYMDYNVPFSLNVAYNLFYQSIPNQSGQINQTLSFNGDLQLTPSWKVSYNSGYDFKANEISYTSLGIYRDLHCWEMSLNWVPFGFQQNFFFQINVKSSVLQDLKLTRKNDRFDNR